MRPGWVRGRHLGQGPPGSRVPVPDFRDRDWDRDRVSDAGAGPGPKVQSRSGPGTGRGTQNCKKWDPGQDAGQKIKKRDPGRDAGQTIFDTWTSDPYCPGCYFFEFFEFRPKVVK